MSRISSLALAIAVASSVGSCAPTETGPGAPIALEQVLSAGAIDVAPVRATARDFVRAYADTGDDRGQALARLVAGATLSEWVRWLGVQNGQFDGVIRGHSYLEDITFVQMASTDEYDIATVAVRGSVVFEYEPSDGDRFERARILDGPMTLVRVGVSDWRVADFTRDGAALSDGIRDLGDVRFQRDGVTLEVHSAFLFAAGWQFNVTIENSTGASVAFGSARLVTASDRIDGVATQPLRRVSPRTGAVGILAFAAGQELSGAVLEVRYRDASGEVILLGVPLSDSIGALPSSSPAPPASA